MTTCTDVAINTLVDDALRYGLLSEPEAAGCTDAMDSTFDHASRVFWLLASAVQDHESGQDAAAANKARRAVGLARVWRPVVT